MLTFADDYDFEYVEPVVVKREDPKVADYFAPLTGSSRAASPLDSEADEVSKSAQPVQANRGRISAREYTQMFSADDLCQINSDLPTIEAPKPGQRARSALTRIPTTGDPDLIDFAKQLSVRSRPKSVEKPAPRIDIITGLPLPPLRAPRRPRSRASSSQGKPGSAITTQRPKQTQNQANNNTAPSQRIDCITGEELPPLRAPKRPAPKQAECVSARVRKTGGISFPRSSTSQSPYQPNEPVGQCLRQFPMATSTVTSSSSYPDSTEKDPQPPTLASLQEELKDYVKKQTKASTKKKWT